jgi:hypothetical protein
MMKIFAGLLLIAALCILIPVGYIASIGFYNGYDVVHGLQTMIPPYTGSGTTISEEKVPSVMHEVTWVGDIENHKLTEASGLAQSNVSPGVFFAINDSGNNPEIYAMDQSGNDLGYWAIDVERNVDWEDLAAFRYKDENYLLIADSGDNYLWRPWVEFFVIKEPDPDSLGVDAIIPIEWSVKMTYPHGYRDSEAVAVDEESETIFVISKRAIPAEVYRIPLQASNDLVQAERMALLNTIPQPNEQDQWESSMFGGTRSQPTALDIKNNVAVVFTYKDAYLYKKGWRESWIQAFAKIPVRIPLPVVHQQESGLITRDRKHLYVTTEREDGTNRAGLYRVEL